MENLDDNEKVEVSRIRKITIAIIGIALIILIISYIIISYPTFNIIRGQLESRLIRDGKIIAGNITIIFTKVTIKTVILCVDTV